MIITKTPFRVSFAGGGTDLAAFYERDYGLVVSAAINKYVYIALHHFFENKIVLKYSKTEIVDKVSEIQHPLIRECLQIVGVNDSIEITSFADIPATGSGLGSSSSFTVGLIKALCTYKRKNISAETCASMACEVEIERLQEPIGKQDQYAAAYGGINLIRFSRDGTVGVEPIIVSPEKRHTLESNLIMFYTGITRSASLVLAEQKGNVTGSARKVDVLHEMRNLAAFLSHELSLGRIEAVGRVMHEGWNLKKQMASGVSSSLIDEYYQRGIKAGAVGGKLLGAGGGGFLLFYCERDKQQELQAALGELRTMHFKLDHQGSRVIYVED